MDRVDCLSAFVHAMEGGSFSAAARRLGITQPTISKRIALLEADLGVQLFVRSTRRLAPTSAGERLYDNARDMLDLYDKARAAAREATPQPTGLLRLSVPSSLGRHLLTPMLAEFVQKYPAVALDIRLTERQVNLIEEGVELALRIGELKASSLRARLLGTVRRFAVASPDYLSSKPALRDPDDLNNHDCIGYSRFGEATRWVFESENGRHVAQVDCLVSLDDADTMQAAVLEGLGIAILPAWLVAGPVADGQLEIVLPDFTIPSLPMHAIYADPRALSLRARRFLDFIVENRDRFATPVAAHREDLSNGIGN